MKIIKTDTSVGFYDNESSIVTNRADGPSFIDIMYGYQRWRGPNDNYSRVIFDDGYIINKLYL